MQRKEAVVVEKPHGNFVGGEWTRSGDAERNENPSDLDTPLGYYAQATQTDVADALTAAQSAAQIWKETTISTRAAALTAVGNEIIARAHELGRLLASEEGKTLFEAKAEAVRAGETFLYVAGELYRSAGEILPSPRPNIEIEVRRHPIGVVGVVTPWNFPLLIPAWKIAPALAYGNAVVFKPSELVPGSAWALTEIISRAGLPRGTFNLLIGKGSDIGEALCGSEALDGITFTGSEATGRAIASAAAGRLARVQLELGGKNSLIILDDAHLETAVECALQGAFFSTGQRCTASSKLIVTEGIYPNFVAALTERVAALRVGHALDPDSQVGPVINKARLEKNLGYIQLGLAEGAAAAVLGQPLHRRPRGHYLSPTLFVDTDPAMRINHEEMFGPIATVVRVKDYEAALEILNDTRYGLVGGIITSSLSYANHFKAHAEVGMAMVNLPTAGMDVHAPFGGTKASSYGPPEQGSYSREFFTKVKTSYVRSTQA